MKSCRNCDVTVMGNRDKCPLCQNPLAAGTAEGVEIFPHIPIVRHAHSMLYRVVLLCSAVAVIVSLFTNWMTPESGFWSLSVVFGVACMWVSLSVAIRKRRNILKNVTYQVTIVSFVALFWDIFTGWHGWSVDFVIPLAFVSATAATAVLATVLKMDAGTYIIHLFLLIVYGVIPIGFVLSGLSDVVYPSLICVAASFTSFVALLIFEGRNMAEELKRRLHL